MMSRCMEAPNDCGGFVGVSGKVPAKRGARPGRWATPVPAVLLALALFSPPPAWARLQGGRPRAALQIMGRPCALLAHPRFPRLDRRPRAFDEPSGGATSRLDASLVLIMDCAVIFILWPCVNCHEGEHSWRNQIILKIHSCLLCSSAACFLGLEFIRITVVIVLCIGDTQTQVIMDNNLNLLAVGIQV